MLSIGININSHYSKGKLYSVSLYGEPETCEAGENEVCEMQKMTDDCEIHEKKDTESNTGSECCEDTSEYLHFNTDYTVPEKLKLSKTTVEKNTTVFFAGFILAKINTSFHTQINCSNIGISPPTILNNPSLFQVFRC